jgi:myo-inositol 2-dehydrogenase/D-chiro-inositol 1-dehydrogenase
MENVRIDDASAAITRFKNGSLGVFEASRYARGHKALHTLEINGELGSIAWDLHDMHRLQWFEHEDQESLNAWRSIHVTDGDHPYLSSWWVPGLAIGFEHSFIHQTADFVNSLTADKPAEPTFEDAIKTERVLDAVLRSAKSGKWERVP